MKRIIFISLTIILFGACDDFLDSNMKSDYSSGNYFTSQDAAIMAVTGVYNSLYGMKWWVFGDVASDDAVKGGNAGDQVDINAIDDFSATSDNGIILVFWRDTYETISRANNVIKYIPQINMNDSLKNRLIGEVKFIRAFSYFNLTNIFGKVPYKTEPQLTHSAIHVGLSEVASIYSKIEEDLKEAISVLPVSYSAEKGRVTKGAAHAMLAKVYLYQKKYSDCLTQIEQLEALKRYNLIDDFSDLFKSGAEDCVEVIFGLRFVNNTEVSLGNEYNVWMAPSHEGGWYFNAPTQSFVDAFSEKTITGLDDPRLDASIGRDGKQWFNDSIFSSTWSEATGYLVKKYNEDRNPLVMPISQSTVPYHYLRYADILLMKAEALNESGSNVANAAVELDIVRARAGLEKTNASTQVAMREAIRVERRKELGFECHRFFDLMRWGKETAEAALGSEFKWTEPRFYFPIPQMELDTNQALK